MDEVKIFKLHVDGKSHMYLAYCSILSSKGLVLLENNWQVVSISDGF